MVRRWLISAVTIAALFVGSSLIIGLLSAQPAARTIKPTGPVVVVAVPGLSWAEVSATRTPALWQVLDYGATANQVVHTVGARACTPNAWLTLGAGHGVAAAGCTMPDPQVSGSTASWPQWGRWRSSADGLGLLGQSASAHGQCIEAVGPGAALAAADPTGRVTHYAASVATASFTRCAITLVTATPAELNTVVGKLSAQTTLILTGLSDGPSAPAGLRAAYALGAAVPAGVLRSASTRQAALVQTADITATLLQSLGARVPAGVEGAAMQVVPIPQSAATATASNAALARTLTINQQLVPWFWGLWALILIVLIALVGRREGRGRWARPILVFLAAVPVATFLACLLPWARWPAPAAMLALLSVAWAALITAIAYSGPWRRWIGGPWVVVTGITTAVLALDVMHGSRLQLRAMLGLQPEFGGRYYGMGNAAYGVFATALLLLAGLLGGRLVAVDQRRPGAWTVGLLTAAAVLVLGLPMWGADFGGPPAVLVAGGVLVVFALGARLSWRRGLLIAGLAIGFALMLGILDALRPPSSRTYLGRFVAGLADGSGGIVIEKLFANLRLLFSSPVSPLTPVVLAVALYVVWRAGRSSGWSWLGRADRWAVRIGDAVGLSEPLEVAADTRIGDEEVPFLRETAIGVLTMCLIAMVINDSGFAIVALAALIPIPFAVALATRDPLPGQ